MDWKHFSVLLVDDDEDDYVLTRDLLAERTGQIERLDWAASYAMALDLARQHSYDIFLIDYHLGAYTGIELIKALHAQGQTSPCLMLTGQGSEAIGIAALHAGAADYLLKEQITARGLERAMHYAIERCRAEEERVQLILEQAARAEAESAVRIRDQFLSIAAHELKTPLTSLFGNLQLLQRRILREHTFSERDMHTLQVAIEQAARLNRMIEALLDISRMQTGQLSIQPELIDMLALVQRVVAEIQPMLEHHTITITGPQETLPVEGDALRLEQVLQNLIQNAVKYSPKGGPITITLARQQDRVAVSITDQGIGIPADALPRLFQRFYRATNVEQQISGMGLGLYVVAEIINLHAGKVEVSSVEGAGSTFRFLLPLSPGYAAGATDITRVLTK